MRRRAAMVAALLAAAALLPSACGPRVEYRMRPGFATSNELPDEIVLEDGTIVRYLSVGEFMARKRARNPARNPARSPAPPAGAAGAEAAPAFVPWEQREDGTVAMRARTPQEAVANTMRALREERYGDLWEQMVSEPVRRRAESEGEGGADAARERFRAWCMRNRADAMTLLNRMSFAFGTNSVVTRPRGDGLFELRLAPQISADFKLRVVEVVIEPRPDGQRVWLAGIR